MKRKDFSLQKMGLVLFFTIIIFAIGIYIGGYTSEQKLNEINDLTTQLRMGTLGVDVQYDILKDNICENDQALYLADELYDISERLGYMENTLGSENDRVRQLKEYYFILESKHWLLAKKQRKTCLPQNATPTLNTTIVLYFYSNAGDCPTCEQQGAVLTYLHEKYSGMTVYSYDINVNTPVVATIKKLYGIGEVSPSLVVNNLVHVGYLNADDLMYVATAKEEEMKNATATT